MKKLILILLGFLSLQAETAFYFKTLPSSFEWWQLKEEVKAALAKQGFASDEQYFNCFL